MHCQLMTHLYYNAVYLSCIHAMFADCFNTFSIVNLPLHRTLLLIVECQIQTQLYKPGVLKNKKQNFHKIVINCFFLCKLGADMILLFEICKHGGCLNKISVFVNRKRAQEFKIFALECDSVCFEQPQYYLVQLSEYSIQQLFLLF